MKKALVIIISVLFVFAVASMSLAAEEKKAATAPAKVEEKSMDKKAPTRVKQVTGEVTAVDAKAQTITVKGRKGDVTAMVGDKTKIMMGKDAKTLDDIKAGDKVKLKYSEADGKMMAKSIAIKKGEKEMGKKAEPAAKPAENK